MRDRLPPLVLVVDDNPDDLELLRLAVDETGLDMALESVTDGDACLARLRGEGRHQGARVPDLVLLDINMPRVDGFHVLRTVRSDPQLCRLRLVVWSTSDNPRDVERMQALGCDEYLTKPVRFEHTMALLVALHRRWLSPPAHNAGP